MRLIFLALDNSVRPMTSPDTKSCSSAHIRFKISLPLPVNFQDIQRIMLNHGTQLFTTKIAGNFWKIFTASGWSDVAEFLKTKTSVVRGA